MCPLCLVASGLYVAGGVSAGAVTTFLATRFLRKRSEPTPSMRRKEDDDRSQDDEEPADRHA